jgi:hypothetical protein
MKRIIKSIFELIIIFVLVFSAGTFIMLMWNKFVLVYFPGNEIELWYAIIIYYIISEVNHREIKH